MPSLWKLGLGLLSVESALTSFMSQEHSAMQSNHDGTSVSTYGVPHVDASVHISENGLLLNAGDMTFQSGLVHIKGAQYLSVSILLLIGSLRKI